MKYSFLDESFDLPIDAANRMADNYLPETSGEQYEDDRWYTLRRMQNMRPGESDWINGFEITAKEM